MMRGPEVVSRPWSARRLALFGALWLLCGNVRRPEGDAERVCRTADGGRSQPTSCNPSSPTSTRDGGLGGARPHTTHQAGKEPEGRVVWLEPDEEQRLLDACRASRTKHLADLVTVALESGLRRGNCLA